MPKKTHVNLDSNFITTSANTTGEQSQIVEFQAPVGHEYQFDPSRPVEFFLQTHEQFTTGGAGSQETFSLSNKVADSPLLDGDSGSDGEDTSPPASGPADVVVYSDGNETAPDAVRYDSHGSNPNQIDYTDGGSVETLDVYYVFRDTYQIDGEYLNANEQERQPVFTGTKGLHTANIYNKNERQTFHNSFTVGPKEKLRFYITTDVDLANWNSNTDDQSAPTTGATSHSNIRLPVTIREVRGRKARSRRGDPGVRPSR